MRTTLDLDDDLFRRISLRAEDEAVSLRAFVEKALRVYLDEKHPYRFTWQTDSGCLQPGVCLEDRDSLFDLMAGPDPGKIKT